MQIFAARQVISFAIYMSTEQMYSTATLPKIQPHKQYKILLKRIDTEIYEFTILKTYYHNYILPKSSHNSTIQINYCSTYQIVTIIKISICILKLT